MLNVVHCLGKAGTRQTWEQTLATASLVAGWAGIFRMYHVFIRWYFYSRVFASSASSYLSILDLLFS